MVYASGKPEGLDLRLYWVGNSCCCFGLARFWHWSLDEMGLETLDGGWIADEEVKRRLW